MPKKAKSKAKSKAKLNIKKSKKGRRAARPKRRKFAVSIPALEAAATEAADFAAKDEAAAAESKGDQHDRVGLALRARAQDVLRCGFPGEMPDHLRVDALGVERVGDGVEARREHTEPAPQQKHTRVRARGTAIEDEDNRDRSYVRTDIPTAVLHALTPKTLMRHLIWKA